VVFKQERTMESLQGPFDKAVLT